MRRQQHSPNSRYKNELNFTSIIYIDDISSTHIFETTLDNLNFVLKLQLNPWNLVLVCMTTLPDNLEAEEHRTKQHENEYWKEAIGKASIVHKFENSHESSWKAVDLIIQANGEMEVGWRHLDQ